MFASTDIVYIFAPAKAKRRGSSAG